MKNEYTTGPWEAVGDEILADEGDTCVAAVPMGLAENPTEWQANMHLIAAAPDLLAALTDLLFEDSDKSDAARIATRLKARAAIAKAEGE